MRLLEDVRTPEEGRLMCENRGSGIDAMLAALRSAGLPAPRFVDRVATFEVTFLTPPPVEPSCTSARHRADRREDVLALLRVRGEMTRGEVAAALGLSGATARRGLAQLRVDGLVEATTIERSPRTRYRLTGARRPAHDHEHEQDP